MVWGTDSEPWSWYFSETNRTHPHSYQVWRPTFDKLLLDNARAVGVDVQEGSRVTDADLSDPASPSVEIATGDGPARHQARFLVDASGQTGLIGRARDLREGLAVPLALGVRPVGRVEQMIERNVEHLGDFDLTGHVGVRAPGQARRRRA